MRASRAAAEAAALGVRENPMLDPKRLEEFYAAVGAAVWHLQFLEDVLVTYVTARLKLAESGLGEAARDVLEAQRRKTFGALVRDAESGGLLRGRVEEAFALIDERNWLIHRSMHEVSDTLSNDADRESATARVRALSDNAIALKKALYAECRAWMKAQGVDVDAAEASGVARYNEIRDA